MTAAEILKMIEEVDPSDSYKLDDIDLEVAVYLATKKDVREHIARLVTTTVNNYPSYTRSRDALKGIRPKGWILDQMWRQICKETFYKFSFLKPDMINPKWVQTTTPDLHPLGTLEDTGTKGLPTEELAELHAIIQAIEYERSGLTPVP